jgi:hypothetical protein
MSGLENKHFRSRGDCRGVVSPSDDENVAKRTRRQKYQTAFSRYPAKIRPARCIALQRRVNIAQKSAFDPSRFFRGRLSYAGKGVARYAW